MWCKFIDKKNFVLGLKEQEEQVVGIVLGSIFVAIVVAAVCFCVVR